MKPASYHEVMKEKNDLAEQNKEYIQSITCLRELNKKLIENMKENDAANAMLVTENSTLVTENATLVKENSTLVKENARLETLSNTYLRTYTNMTIELLKLEEKLAKLEGRGW
jgi:2-succinyl-5-enolpyruvyl-6-hydroxy-3-cyclohexene-1-carboxylate synthase